jgi:hypothetical protein
MGPVLNVSDIMRAFDECERTPVKPSPPMESAIRYATFKNLCV